MTPPDARPWLFLTVSTLFEVVWIVSLRMTEGFTRFAPLLVYAVSGLGAAVCLSVAMKIIPMGTAYAFWMGASVVGVLPWTSPGSNSRGTRSASPARC